MDHTTRTQKLASGRTEDLDALQEYNDRRKNANSRTPYDARDDEMLRGMWEEIRKLDTAITQARKRTT